MTYTPRPVRFLLTALTATALVAGPLSASSALASPSPVSSSPVSSESSSSPARSDDNHRVVHRDARRDVLRFDNQTEQSSPAPRDSVTDITRTVVDHRADRLVVKTTARDLTRSGYRLVIAEILASDGRRYQLTTDYSARPLGPSLGAAGSRVELTHFHSSRPVPCAGATWAVDRAKHAVTTSIPTSCLDAPKWVEVGVALIGAPQSLELSWGDDSRTTGRLADEHLTLGPRQHHA